mmetsp:Transcript_26964/g.75823  ORF Transcript_26964/g.75823 Transcript_26964/m.75823 type:complete len:288 (-) Transcript_26964:822-1685(-)
MAVRCCQDGGAGLRQRAPSHPGRLVHGEQQRLRLSNLLDGCRGVHFRAVHGCRLRQVQSQSFHDAAQRRGIRTGLRVGADPHPRDAALRIHGRASSGRLQILIEPQLTVRHADEIVNVLQHETPSAFRVGRDGDVHLAQGRRRERDLAIHQHAYPLLELVAHGIEILLGEDPVLIVIGPCHFGDGRQHHERHAASAALLLVLRRPLDQRGVERSHFGGCAALSVALHHGLHAEHVHQNLRGDTPQQLLLVDGVDDDERVLAMLQCVDLADRARCRANGDRLCRLGGW